MSFCSVQICAGKMQLSVAVMCGLGSRDLGYARLWMPLRVASLHSCLAAFIHTDTPPSSCTYSYDMRGTAAKSQLYT